MSTYYPFLLLLYVSAVFGNNLTERGHKQARIVGGKPCQVSDYPFMVSVRLSDPMGLGNYSHYCGGSVLNKKWILSAAHCYSKDRNNDMEHYLVVAGISNHSHFSTKSAQHSKLVQIVTKGYDAELHDNDVALLKLKSPLNKSSTVQFVTLPANSIYPADISEVYIKCTTLGWGIMVPVDLLGNSDDADTVYPDQLMCINLPLISFEDCREIFEKKKLNISLTVNQVCTMHSQAGKDACGGDSGGPLVCGKLQHGIISWGLGCAQLGFPGVYTRVDRYVEWIKSVTRKIQSETVALPLTTSSWEEQVDKYINNKNESVQLLKASTLYLVCNCTLVLFIYYIWLYLNTF